MSYLVYAYTLLTILAFVLAVKINQRWKSVVLNSFVLTVLMLVAVLLAFHLPYDTYMAGNAPLNNLLGVSIVALAVPLYEQIRQIARHWQIILITTVSASLLSMMSGAVLALLLGAKPDIVATILPKSITTPIAMAVSENLGGIPSVARLHFRLFTLKKNRLKKSRSDWFIRWGCFSCVRHGQLHGK